MKPFRFSVGLRQARPRAEVAEKTRRVETLGYDLLGAADHLTDGYGARHCLNSLDEVVAT